MFWHVPTKWDMFCLAIGGSLLIAFLFSLAIGDYTFDSKTGKIGYLYNSEQKQYKQQMKQYEIDKLNNIDIRLKEIENKLKKMEQK